MRRHPNSELLIHTLTLLEYCFNQLHDSRIINLTTSCNFCNQLQKLEVKELKVQARVRQILEVYFNIGEKAIYNEVNEDLESALI